MNRNKNYLFIRYLALVLCLVICVGMLSGCGKKAGKEEILNYNKMMQNEVFPIQNTLTESVNKAFAGGLGMYKELSETTYPTAREFKNKVQNIKITNKDLQETHNLYISYAEAVYNAVECAMESLEKVDASKSREARDLIDTANKYQDQYDESLNALKEKYDAYTALEQYNKMYNKS